MSTVFKIGAVTVIAAALALAAALWQGGQKTLTVSSTPQTALENRPSDAAATVQREDEAASPANSPRNTSETANISNRDASDESLDADLADINKQLDALDADAASIDAGLNPSPVPTPEF
jgi:hypothetical protein